MPSKKKKYNARFPPMTKVTRVHFRFSEKLLSDDLMQILNLLRVYQARIKKIMQTDDDVGKVAAAVPVIISRSLELFIESLILKTSETTKARNAKTLSTAHIKQTIQSERRFDFLKDLVANVPDVQPENEESEPRMPAEPTAPRPRGRPRKKKEEKTATPKKRGRKKQIEQKPVVSEESDDSSATEDATSDIDGVSADECEEEETESSRVPGSDYPPNPQLFPGAGPPHHAEVMGQRLMPPAALGASPYLPPYTAGSTDPSPGHSGHFYPPGPNPHFFPPGGTVASQPGQAGHYLPPPSTSGSQPNTGQSAYFPECNSTQSQVKQIGQSSPYFPESTGAHTHPNVSQPGESASYFPPSTATIPQPTTSQRSNYFHESFTTHSKPQPGLNSHFYHQSSVSPHCQPNIGHSSQHYPGSGMMSPTTGSEYYPPANMITSRPGIISQSSVHAQSSPDQHNIQHMPLNLSSKGTMPESEPQKHAEGESLDKLNTSGQSQSKAEMPQSGTVPGKMSSGEAEKSFMPGFYQPKLIPPTSEPHNCTPASFQDGALSKDQMSVVSERSLLTAEGAAADSNTDDDYDS